MEQNFQSMLLKIRNFGKRPSAYIKIKSQSLKVLVGATLGELISYISPGVNER